MYMLEHTHTHVDCIDEANVLKLQDKVAYELLVVCVCVGKDVNFDAPNVDLDPQHLMLILMLLVLNA